MIDANAVSEAVVLWLGREHSAWPLRDDDAVRSRFGDRPGSELIDKLVALEREFYEAGSSLAAEDLTGMFEAATARFKALHPELTADAVAAFGWAYTYDNR